MPAQSSRLRVVVLVGSATDLPTVRPVLRRFVGLEAPHRIAEVALNVVSCHRNPYELLQFVEANCHEADMLIAAAGKAAALPGVLDAWVNAVRRRVIPVFGIALGESGSQDLLAAQLSIEKLPGTPVILDPAGHAYTGPEGLAAALERIDQGELPLPNPRASKAVGWNIDI